MILVIARNLGYPWVVHDENRTIYLSIGIIFSSSNAQSLWVKHKKGWYQIDMFSIGYFFVYNSWSRKLTIWTRYSLRM